MKKILLLKGANTVFNRKHFEESCFMVVVVTDGYDGMDVLEICEFEFILIDNKLLDIRRNELYSEVRNYCDTPIYGMDNSESILSSIILQNQVS